MNAWSLISIGLSVIALGLALWALRLARKAAMISSIAIQVATETRRRQNAPAPGPLDDLVPRARREEP